MIVRPERPGDIDVIRAVHDAAFGGGGEGRLVDALRAAAKLVVSLVAERDGEVVGHIGFSPVTSSAAARGLGLAPLAVRPDPGKVPGMRGRPFPTGCDHGGRTRGSATFRGRNHLKEWLDYATPRRTGMPRR